jgi:hypothetical protein
MEQIEKITYWLGVACLIAALAWRLIKIGIGPVAALDLAPLSFYRGALVLFVASIATRSYRKTKA